MGLLFFELFHVHMYTVRILVDIWRKILQKTWWQLFLIFLLTLVGLTQVKIDLEHSGGEVAQRTT